MLNYLISISNDEAVKDGTIHDVDSKLKVKAFNPSSPEVKPVKGEVMYFVTSSNQTLAFETKGYKKHRKLLILQMIAWYCLYLGLIEAQIHSTWPL